MGVRFLSYRAITLYFQTSQSEGPQLLLSEAVGRAARAAGVLPISPSLSLQGELESPELQEEYTRQVNTDAADTEAGLIHSHTRGLPAPQAARVSV